MLYSFCQIRVTVLAPTLPWQLLAAQLPGPLYLPTFPAVDDGCFSWDPTSEAILPITNKSAATTVVSSFLARMAIRPHSKFSAAKIPRQSKEAHIIRQRRPCKVLI